MMRPLARWLVRVSSWLAPRDLRARFREEWLAEIDAHRGPHGTETPLRSFRRAAGAPLDAWLARVDTIGMPFGPLAYDIRHTLRKFARMPAFTITALAVIALGIAANVTVFSIANAVLLKPSTFPDPDRVVLFQTTSPTGSDTGASPAMYGHWRKETGAIQDVAAFHAVLVNYSGGGVPEQIRANRVSADYFRLFGADLLRGRTFSESEDRPDGAHVVVLSHQLWSRRFSSQPEVVGQAIRLNGESYTVIGVLGPAFQPDDFGPAPEVWLPLQLDPQSKTHGYFFSVGGRLRPGVTLAQARARLQLSTAAFRREFPDVLSDRRSFTVQPVREALVGRARPMFLVLLGAVGFVLLIACSNVAGLLLSQAASRGREMAVRAALGAGRGRIVRQLLTESLVLSLSGGAIGLALGFLALHGILTSGLPRLPRVNDLAGVGLDWRVAAFAVGVSIATGVLFGLVPAIYMSRADLHSATRSSDGRASVGPGQRRMQAILVVFQVSVALVLLIGSVLFMRTLVALTRVDAGFDPHQVLTLRTSLSGPDFATAPRVEALIRRGTDALYAVPGATVVGAASGLPLEGGSALPFVIVGRPLPANQPFHGGGGWLAISPGFVEAFKIRVSRGRSFTDRDVLQSPPVALINEVMARQYWPGRDPIGERLVLGHGIGREFQDEPERQVVGVVGDTRAGALDQEPGAQVYVPQAQLPDVANAFIVSTAPVVWIVRTATTSPESLARPLQAALEQATGLPVSTVRSMDEIMLRSIGRQRFSMWLMTAFGLSALLLAATGIYGLIAYSVEQRTREIGIRLALGAESSRVRAMVVGQGMRLTVAGVAIGLVAALGLARVTSRFLYQVQAWDPTTFVAVPLLVILVALLAAWLPARRASRIDPNVALRYE